MMDCDTTGIEPDLGLVKMKNLVGGGTMLIVNQTVPRALDSLGYNQSQVDDIIAYIDTEKTIVGAPHLRKEHVPVFACSMGVENTIKPLGHVRMMGAVQPFLSGAISKTVNMPEEASVEDIEQLHMDSWKLGLKAVAIYRDNCKVAQPLSQAKKEGAEEAPVAEAAAEPAGFVTRGMTRRELPRVRSSKTYEFRVSSTKGFFTIGEYEDGTPAELFLQISKQGSTLAGVMDALAISVSQGLQYGVPLKTYVRMFTNMAFAPAGITDDTDVRTASSLVDYVFRRLGKDYLSFDDQLETGISHLGDAPAEQPQLIQLPEDDEPTPAQEAQALENEPDHAEQSAGSSQSSQPKANRQDDTSPICSVCGNLTQRSGACYVCPACGTTTGCS